MRQSKRDTHFADYAEKLYYALAALKGNLSPHQPDHLNVDAEQKLIAQYAYDLVQHTINHIQHEVHNGNFMTWLFPSDISNPTFPVDSSGLDEL